MQLWRQNGGGENREGEQLYLTRDRDFYRYFFFSEILVCSIQLTYTEHLLCARLSLKCHGGNMGVIIKDGNNLVMKMYMNKFPAPEVRSMLRRGICKV